MAASKFRIASSSFTGDASFSGSVVFNQDVTVSGTLSVYEMKTTLVSSSIIFKSGSTKFGDTSDDLHQFTGSAEFSSGLSGSLTRLVDGTDYLIAGDNISITTQSNGSLVITSSGGGGGGTPGGSNTQVQFNDGGSFGGSSNFTFNNTTNTLTVSNISGSLTQLSDGTSYLIAGNNVTITSGSNGAVTIESSDTSYTGGTGLNLAGTEFSIDDSVVATLSGSQFSGNVGITGSVGITSTLDVDGTLSVAEYIACTTDSNTHIRFNGADTIQLRAGGITVAQITESTQDVYLHNPDTNDIDFQINTSNFRGTLFVDSADDTLILGNEGFDTSPSASEVSGYGTDVKVYISGTIGSKDTATRGVTLIAGDSIVSGTLYAPTAISGSLTKLTDGTSYLIAGTDISITTGSNGAITVASTAASVSSINDLSDVAITSPPDTSILVYNSSAGEWRDQVIFGDATIDNTGVITVTSASSAGKIDTTSVNPIATYYIPFVENSTTTEGDIVHVSSNVTVNQAGSFSAAGVTATGNVNAGAALVHDGDSDTKIAFTTDRIKIEAGGVEFFDFLEGTSDSATFNLDGVDIDFRMLSNNLAAAIHLDSGNDQLVLMGNQDIHSKYFGASGIPSDVNLFVSGTAGSKGTSTKGTTLFAGDIVVSGSLYDSGGNEIISLGGSPFTASLGIQSRGDVYVAGNADSGLILESPLMATSRIYGKLASADPRVTDSNTYIDFDASDGITLTSAAKSNISISDGLTVFNEGSQDIDLRIETNNKQSMVMIDGGTDQILINGHPDTREAADESSLGNDTGIFLSGSRGAIGTSTKGVTTIVGDLVVSGNIFQDDLGFTNNIYLETNLISTYEISGRDRTSPFNGGRDTNTSITFNSDEISFKAGGIEMLTLDEATADNVIVNTNGVDVNFRVETNNLQAAIYSDGGTDQVVLGGNLNNISNYLLGTDTNILLSGTIGSKGTSTKGTTVASGDFVVSGSFHNPGIVHVGAFQSSAVSNIATDTYVRVPFNAVLKGNTNGGFSSGIFTAPFDGYYQINANVVLFSIDVTANSYSLYVTSSDGFKTLLDVFNPNERYPAGDTASNSPNMFGGSTTLFLSKDQAASVFVYQSGGASQTDIPGKFSNDGLDGSNITITKIG